jgi:phosphatidylserine/phosphatidylglycerophosphate/cardiolipin synthase-like enzyme
MAQIYTSIDDDLAEIVRERIVKARNRVYACLYILSYPYIAQSLLFARKRECDVKVLLSDDPINVEAASYLEANKISVKTMRKSKGILHIKMFICDDVALLGSYNPTYYASSFNVELLIEIRDRVVVEDLAAFFMRLWRMC